MSIKTRKRTQRFFVASLLAIIIAILGSFRVDLQRDSNKHNPNLSIESPQWTLPAEQSAQVSKIHFISPDGATIRAKITIENRPTIQIEDTGCRYENCQKFFDIRQLKTHIDKGILSIDFNEMIVKKGGDRTLSIALPSKDWQWRAFPNKTQRVVRIGVIANKEKAVNLEFAVAHSLAVEGNFNRLTIWQQTSAYYQNIEMRLGHIDTLNVYGQSVILSLHDKSTLDHLNIHSCPLGNFFIKDFRLLKRSKWQELTPEESQKLKQLSNGELIKTPNGAF